VWHAKLKVRPQASGRIEMTERIVFTYADKKAIGTIEMSDKQYASYVDGSDRDTGAILFGDLMSYGLEYVASDIVDTDVTVYVEE
jgi:hypothetical protein